MREDWAAQAAATVEHVVDLVRDRTVVPARAAAKAVVYGLLAGMFVAVVTILVVIAFFRGAFLVTGEVWGAYLWTGAILVVAGIICWTRRAPRSDETPT